ncbi:PKD domain-containing protein [Psychroserpens algicola]|uniref:PKD domain-containing protein n=1 Tax=Psychroserpens algicola TaxID=1719034 RepID=UPI001953CDC1|nr:PKD domain-containing protein [Psychroserpens algicola]
MKIVKYAFSLCLLALAIYGCSKDDDNSNFVDDIAAPTNVSANVVVTQDNTGLVTITPLGEGVTIFRIGFGDQSDPVDNIQPGNSVSHTYEEGTYEATVTATGLNGLTTTIVQQIVVSFQAPENLMVTIENDTAISRQVNVTASADFAISYEVDFGEVGSSPIMANIDDTVSFQYEAAGTYTVTVTAFSAAIETTSYTEEFVVTEILQPLAAAPTPPNRQDSDVISMFSNAYELDVNVSSWRSDWSTSTLTDLQIAGDDTKFYADADFVGVEFYGDAAVDASQMDAFHLDFWSVNATTFRIKLVDLGGTATEAEIVFEDLPQNEWVSIDIPMSDFTDAGMTSINSIQQLIFSGIPVGTFDFFIDNVYFYRAPTTTAEGLEGTWRMAPEAGSLGVGPAVGDISWFSCDADCVTLRDCYFDDAYIFGSDGSFTNDLGAESWIEGWQGGGDSCGTPVAPHDGSNSATYTYDDVSGTVTLNGTGAFLGLAKANNQGELPNVAVPSSITYNVTFTGANSIDVYIESGAGVFWQYKMVRDAVDSNPLEGTWVMAPEAGSLGVGPAVGDTSWFACDADCVTLRDCYFDDTYVFGSDGSFSNNLGAESWIEGWQGGGDSCGTPVAPHDGSNAATYTYDDASGTVTIDGVGAYIGLAKANNQGELPNVAVPSSITYNVTFIDANTINVYVESGAGVFWQYKLVKQ